MLAGQRLTAFVIGIALLHFVASSLMSRAVEVVSQQIEISSSSQVTSANGGYGALDQDNRSNYGLGDRSLRSSTLANFNDVEVSSEASIEVHRTNSVSADTFQIQSRLALHSEDFLSVTSTQLNTRASATAILTLQVRFETPIRYSIQKAGHFNLPGGGGILITAQNGSHILNQGWTTGTTAPSDSSGVLPPGTYTVRFSDNASADGTVSPALVNHIEGDSESLLTITFTPASATPIPAPYLNLLRDSTNRVVLELGNLQPGMYYTIERGDSLQPNSWQYLVQFTAAGTSAKWTDTFNDHSPTTFYRLRL